MRCLPRVDDEPSETLSAWPYDVHKYAVVAELVTKDLPVRLAAPLHGAMPVLPNTLSMLVCCTTRPRSVNACQMRALQRRDVALQRQQRRGR